MRQPHWLTRNEGGEYPREVVVMDTETREVRLKGGLTAHRLVFGWAFYARRVRGDRWECQRWQRFATRAVFWDWIEARLRVKSRLTIYCHNAEFDAQVVAAFEEMESRGFRCVSACLEGPPTIIKWRRDKSTVQWLDTLNLFRVPLAVIGKRLKLPKLKMPNRWGSKARDDAYCKRDVEIVWKALLEWWQFLRDHNLGTAAPTLAGQAMNAYRHRFMKVQLFIDSNPAALELSRRAYVGGRCECFRIGFIDTPGVTLDINSMYPFVMRTLQCPTRLLTVRSTTPLDVLARYLETYALIADVTLVTDEPAYPHVVEGRLCFPVGRFRQVLASPELRYALRAGHVARCHAVAVYERAAIFRGFVDWMWSERTKARKRGDALMDWLIKIVGNSLYGKFGQRGRKWEVVDECPRFEVGDRTSYDIDAGRWVYRRQIGHALQELSDDGESMHSFPAIAAHVTSAARLYLWTLIKRAGLANVWYSDTDSIKGPRVLLQRLRRYISKDRLGALKLEERFAWLTIRGAKDYQSPNNTKRKGVRQKAVTNDGVAFEQLQWFGWAGSIRRGSLDAPLTRKVVKVLTGDYCKGVIGAGGFVTPLVLPLDTDGAGATVD